jgi:cupin 2 domain-containing protein
MSHSKCQNLFDSIPAEQQNELFTILAESGNTKIERIVSHGHTSPDGFWYDQDQSEWVCVLSGEALLRFKNEAEAIHLKLGDNVLIPPHVKHRVEWTSPDEPTIWLAVFYS